MVSSSGCAAITAMRPSNITACHLRAEIGEFVDLFGWTRIVRAQAFFLRSEAESQGHVEFFKRAHLAIEPCERIGAETIGPAQTRAQMFHAEVAQKTDAGVE